MTRALPGALLALCALADCAQPLAPTGAPVVSASQGAGGPSVAPSHDPTTEASGPTPSASAAAASAPFAVSHIFWVDEHVGWALHADLPVIVSRTEDGGQTWSERGRFAIEADDQPPGAQVTAADREHAWVAWLEVPDSVETARTSNGGKTWARTSVKPKSVPESAMSLAFTSLSEGRLDVENQHGMSTPPGWGPTFLTHDGGATWAEIPRPPARGWTAQQDCSTCKAALLQDGKPASLEAPASLRCASPNRSLVVTQGPALDRAGNGLLVASCNEGPETEVPFFLGPNDKRWTAAPPLQGEEGQRMILLPRRTTWRITPSAAFVSKDDAKTWSRFDAPCGASLEALRDAAEISFVNADTGWILVPGQRLCRTDDGGATWEKIAP